MNEKKELLLMLDLETLGTKPGCVILSVAMKTFTLDGSAPAERFEFADNINVMSSLIAGFNIDQGTIDWWRKQSDDAKASIIDSSVNSNGVGTVIGATYRALQALNKNYNLYICGRGVSTFDMPILDAAMRKVIGEGYETPWNYWAATDVRSIHRFAKWCGLDTPSAVTQHDAMADVEKQIEELTQSYNYCATE